MMMGNGPDRDWSDDFDDLGPGDWEQHMGGPEDEYFDPPPPPKEPDPWEEMDDPTEEPDGAPDGDDGDGASNAAQAGRKGEVLAWLARSPLAQPLRNGAGFLVARGGRVRLQDGREMEVLEWLAEEGFEAGAPAGDYEVAYTPPGGAYREKLTFFRRVWAVPF